MIKQSVFFLLLLFFPWNTIFSQGGNFLNFPTSNQLYQRNPYTNSATIPIRGSIWQTSASLRVKTFKNNVLLKSTDFQTSLSSGQASFDVSIDLPAALATYRIEAYAVNGSSEQFLRSADGVLSGDAYLVMGQSNAVAGYGVISNNTFLRMFGWEGWKPAESNIGMWQIAICEDLIQKFGVPVAFINTAVSGSYISENMPGTSIFQGTSTLIENSGLKNHIRGFFWFQGESDASSGFTADYYLNSYKVFDAGINQMIAKIDRKYIIQIRNGCWGQPDDANPIREVQRKMPEILPNYGIMTTQGLQHDGCHFNGQGYLDLGKNLARLMGRDLYNAPNLPNIQAPNPHHAFVVNGNQLKLVTRDGRDVLSWVGAAQSEFQLNNANGVYITGGSASKSVVTLFLSGNLPAGATLTYKGHGGGFNTEPVVRNANGVGILAFHALPILPAIPVEICTNNIDDDGNGLTDGMDATACDCLTNPAVSCNTFDCATLYIGVDSTRIKLQNTAAAILTVKVRDANNTLIYDFTYTDSLNSQILPNFGSGRFQVEVTAYNASWQVLCQKIEILQVTAGPSLLDCDGISFEAKNNKIRISGLTSPIVFIHLFDKNWQLKYDYLQAPTGSTMEIPNLAAGNYHIKVTLATANWQEICVLSKDLGLDLAPPPTTGTDCKDIVITKDATSIYITNINATNRSIQVWNPDWSKAYNCLGTDCNGSSLTIPASKSGKYHIKIEYFNATWGLDCTREEDISSPVLGRKAEEDATSNPLSMEDILLYPNPSQGFVQIASASLDARSQILLFDTQGKLWLRQDLNSPFQTLDLSNFPKGVYFLKWTNQGKVGSKKLVLMP